MDLTLNKARCIMFEYAIPIYGLMYENIIIRCVSIEKNGNNTYRITITYDYGDPDNGQYLELSEFFKAFPHDEMSPDFSLCDNS